MSRNSSGFTPGKIVVLNLKKIYKSRNSSGFTPSAKKFELSSLIYKSRNSSGFTPSELASDDRARSTRVEIQVALHHVYDKKATII